MQASPDPVVAGYIALSRLPAFRGGLDTRTSLLVALRAAELSGCRWCIERCRHDCRQAGVAPEHLTERERVAVAFVETVALAQLCGREADRATLERARCAFADPELAELTAILGEHHCLEPLTHHQIAP